MSSTHSICFATGDKVHIGPPRDEKAPPLVSNVEKPLPYAIGPDELEAQFQGHNQTHLGDNRVRSPSQASHFDRPYVQAEYANVKRPRKVAVWLFWFGFMCPILWVAGGIMFFAHRKRPATVNIAVAPIGLGGAVDQIYAVHKHDIAQTWRYYKAERKWQKCCAWAVVVGAVVSGIISGVVIGLANQGWV
ncbi:hypothetical protein CONPUDRAFT_157565 [Coniophora puteana RWD-64-598 SS2]|uniref:Uncharacterized protein n=1 Tax=Coniophora puteana (strain RWD-64-598) TaxID=741705 RepID=A0A5M3MET9_CONPW|nr:uncharacterized protein CONPUDRAFT_157565 [Coniophora puteana RWD-64-598 SS2]EIW77314.1 hypothetical protein CONPUDRAFT_157565 [Coniophora puteana RWD-64-598 SS2]